MAGRPGPGWCSGRGCAAARGCPRRMRPAPWPSAGRTSACGTTASPPRWNACAGRRRTGTDMDVNEAARLVSERLSGRDSVDVGVKVEVVPAGWLSVHIHSRNPAMWLHTGVELHSDGRVLQPPADDGCTPIGTPHKLVGSATTVAEAVDLVVAEAELTITNLTKRIAEQLVRDLPAAQPPVRADDLAKACELWQRGQDVGSSFLRGAGRALTGIPHYFRANFIADQEQKARRSPEALRAGVALLRAVNSAERRDADGWNTATGLPAR